MLVFSNIYFTDSNNTLIETSAITFMSMSFITVTRSNNQLFKIISKYLHLLFIKINFNTYPLLQSGAITDFAAVPSIFIESQNVLVSNISVSKNNNINGEIILFYHPQLENHHSNITIQSSRFSNNHHTALKILNQGAIIEDSSFEFNNGIIGGGISQILDNHTDISLFQTNMLILKNTSFIQNTATYGGTISIYYSFVH